MIEVVGIRFKDSGKTYYFAPGDLELHQGDMVIVDTVRGPEMAKVSYERFLVSESEIVGELKPVLRHVESTDYERMRLFHARHEEVLLRCAEKIKEHDLPMDLVKAEYSFDGSRLTFYFTSEQRVDFRMLVRDLARTFKSRIELRQIGPRDEAKLLGGLGPCGRLLCCATFLPDYARVSIKMAKDQDLPLNPSKISGVCGRLLCCLSYEHQQYLDMKAEMPSKGDWVQTPDGPGDVVSVNVLRAAMMVRLASSGMEAEYTVDQVQRATVDVGRIARSRVQEGITPIANLTPDELNGQFLGGRQVHSPGDEVDEEILLDLLDEDSDELASYTLHKPDRSRFDKAPTVPGKRHGVPTSESADTSATPSSRRSSSRRKRKKSASTQEPDANKQAASSTPDSTPPPSEQKAPTAESTHRRRRRRPGKKKSEGSGQESGNGE